MFNRKNRVSVVKGYDIPVMVKEAIDLLGGVEKFISPGDKVLLKPNMSGANKAPASTGIGILDALTGLLLDYGAGEVIIGDGTGLTWIETSEMFRGTGFDKVARKYNITLKDLNKDDFVTVKVPDYRVVQEIKISKTVLESDVVINVPVMKTHCLTGVSLSMKNIKGIMTPREKRRFHEIGLHDAIVDLNSIFKPTLNIIDGILAMEGLGPVDGDPLPFNTVIAGENTVALDATAARIMGIDPMEVKHIMLGYQRGLGEIRESEIEVVGCSIAEAKKKFKPPTAKSLDSFPGVKVVGDNPCSGCIVSVSIALTKLEKRGDLKNAKDLVIGIGSKGYTPAGNFVCIGNCAQKYKDKCRFIKGCPPAVNNVEDDLRKQLGLAPIYGLDHLR